MNSSTVTACHHHSSFSLQGQDQNQGVHTPASSPQAPMLQRSRPTNSRPDRAPVLSPPLLVPPLHIHDPLSLVLSASMLSFRVREKASLCARSQKQNA